MFWLDLYLQSLLKTKGGCSNSLGNADVPCFSVILPPCLFHRFCILVIQSEILKLYNKNTIWVSCLFSFVLFKIFFFIGKSHVHPMGLEPMTLLLPFFLRASSGFFRVCIYLFPVATGKNYFCFFYVFFAAVNLNDSKYVLVCQQAWIVVKWLCSGLPSVSPCLAP